MEPQGQHPQHEGPHQIPSPMDGLRRRWQKARRGLREAPAPEEDTETRRQRQEGQLAVDAQAQHHVHGICSQQVLHQKANSIGKTAEGAGALLLQDSSRKESVGSDTAGITQYGGRGREIRTHRRLSTEGEVDVAEDDLCCFDWGLLIEPVTMLCGHTFCRHCVGIILEDSQIKTQGGTPHTPGAMKCPLCCRSLPAVLPQPNVRLRNELRAKYPDLYAYRMETVGAAFVEKESKMRRQGQKRGTIMTPEDLEGLLAAHQRRVTAARREGLAGGQRAGPRGGGILRFLRRRQIDALAVGEEGEEEEEEEEGGRMAGIEEEEEEGMEVGEGDPVFEAVELFQSELVRIWRSRRYLCWILSLFVLMVGLHPLRLAPLPGKAAQVEAILRVDTWREWFSLERCLAVGDTAGAVDEDSRSLSFCRLIRQESVSPRPSSVPAKDKESRMDDDVPPPHPRRGHDPPLPSSSSPASRLEDTAFPGSELLATIYMYPSWGWIERVSRGVEGTVIDLLRVLQAPTPASILGAFPGFGMGVYALAHHGWSAPFRELVAFLAIEGEIRQFMAVWTVLTIPTRIPRNPLDIPPLGDMPAYAWTVLSLTLAQGAYLLACEMFATLLDVVALSPMLLALTQGTCWRSEASLIATVLVRFWLMLREDVRALEPCLGRYTALEATILRLFILLSVFTAPLWAPRPMFNGSDLVSALTSAGGEVVTEIMGEMRQAANGRG